MRIARFHPPFAQRFRALFARLPADWSPPFRLFTVLARDERLLLRFTGSAVSYLQPSHVTPRQRQGLLLRGTARRRRAPEWGMGVHYLGERGVLNAVPIYPLVPGG